MCNKTYNIGNKIFALISVLGCQGKICVEGDTDIGSVVWDYDSVVSVKRSLLNKIVRLKRRLSYSVIYLNKFFSHSLPFNILPMDHKVDRILMYRTEGQINLLHNTESYK